jgi:hypothetical protein
MTGAVAAAEPHRATQVAQWGGSSGMQALTDLGIEPHAAAEALSRAIAAMGPQRSLAASRVTAQQAGSAPQPSSIPHEA